MKVGNLVVYFQDSGCGCEAQVGKLYRIGEITLNGVGLWELDKDVFIIAPYCLLADVKIVKKSWHEEL